MSSAAVVIGALRVKTNWFVHVHVIMLLLVELYKSSFQIQSLSVTTENELTFRHQKL